MLGKLAAVILAVVCLSGSAFAQVQGTLQQQFTCPAQNCSTQCVGPGGAQTIKSYKVLKAYMLSQPDRLWLDLDDTTMIVLGVGDRCTFAGTPLPITGPPPEQSKLGDPPKQACTCIGTKCTPPGCSQPIEQSPLR